MHAQSTRPLIRSSISLAVVWGMALASPAWAAQPTTTDTAQTDDAASSKDTSEAPSEANDTDARRAAELVQQGAAAYQAKDLERAITLFEEAYELDPKPNLVFNIGRVYEELGDLNRAIEFYSRFTVQKGIRLETRKLAAERIRVLRDILSQSQSADDAQAPAAATASESPPPAQLTTPSAYPPEDRPEPTPVDRGRNLRIAGYSLLGVGLGAGAAALGFGISGLTNEKEAQRQCAPLCRESEVETIHQQLIAADVLGAVSGAFLATSVVLLAVGFKRKASSRDRKVAALASPGHVGLRVRW